MAAMPIARLTASTSPASTIEAGSLVIGIVPSPDGVRLFDADDAALAPIGDQIGMLGLTGAVDETSRIPAPEGVTASSVLVVGLGRGPMTADALRYAAGTAARALASVEHVVYSLPTTTPAEVQAVFEGAALGGYRYVPSTGPSAPMTSTTTVTVATGVEDAASAVEIATVTSRAVTLVRDLVMTPPNELYPESFVERARSAIGDLPIDMQVWDVEQLEAGGFGGILGVGQGSARPPRLVALRYRADADNSHLALVGKGITFDSGGLSLKPPAGMVGMKYDMTGAATVLAVVVAAAELGIETRLTGWLCLAENMPSGSALRPNDVITMRGGQTVEVLNTDAEGRLVMADGLVAASEENPDAIIDVATLTGAARVALGERFAGVMGDNEVISRVRAAADETGELVWPMPLPAELRPLLKSDVATIANAKPGNTAAGMLLAGVFLREFVGRRGGGDDAPSIPWAHLDIAGPANNSTSPFGHTPKGASGVMVRLLVRVAEAFSTKE